MTERGRVQSPFSSFGRDDQREAFRRDEAAQENRSHQDDSGGALREARF
jgi:hypothetical protein